MNWSIFFCKTISGLAVLPAFRINDIEFLWWQLACEILSNTFDPLMCQLHNLVNGAVVMALFLLSGRPSVHISFPEQIWETHGWNSLILHTYLRDLYVPLGFMRYDLLKWPTIGYLLTLICLTSGRIWICSRSISRKPMDGFISYCIHTSLRDAGLPIDNTLQCIALIEALKCRISQIIINTIFTNAGTCIYIPWDVLNTIEYQIYIPI